ncbi:hypothetical protein [Sphingosinicella sp. BN140058]|uniref:hypothetical protein n=1 Tax=Sphingosinicella sp. BN140058 TaxID=1892855 RepID=UPI0010117A60|nr:hypothetical protein [Sphingosinicella sp. BN140058]QAY76417.1 hypothetical protein ETR14_07870 [Sphingosinicella sp. BN140058]
MRRLEERVRRLERLFESRGPILDLRPLEAGTRSAGDAADGTAADETQRAIDDAGKPGRRDGGVDHG